MATACLLRRPKCRWTGKSAPIEYAGVDCPGVIAIVPEENDVALAKLVAWREKDWAWLNEGIKAGIISLESMEGRLDRMPVPNSEGNPPGRDVLKQRLLSLGGRPVQGLPKS
jgi:hypothetical protein